MRETVQRPERFSEEEVQQVLRRAAELQQQDSRVPTDVRALSLAELEQIAADSGIDVQQIHRAILELEGRRHRAGSVLLGAPARVHLERVVKGESPRGAFEPLVSEMNRALETAGQVSTLGGTLTWSAPNTSSGPVDVTISPIEGGTRIELNASFGGLLGATFGGIGGGLGGGLGIPLAAAIGQLTQSWAAAGGTIALALGLPLLLARLVYATIVRRRIHRLEQLVDQVSEQLSAVAQKAP
jgi:hypothetical protein